MRNWLIVDRALRITALASVFALGAVGTIVKRGLYGDGAFFFLLTLEPGHPSLFHPSRWFSQLLNQAPVLIAKKLGVQNYDWLLSLHSFGLVMIPTLLWLAALFLHLGTRYFWPLAIGYATTFLVTGFFSIGEYNVAFALVGLSFALLVKRSINWIGDLTLILSSVLLVRSYESMLFLGPLLFAIALHRLVGLPAPLSTQLRHRLALAISSFLFAMSAGVAYLGILNPIAPSNMVSAVDLVKASVFSPTSALILLLGLFVIVTVVWNKWQASAFLGAVSVIVALVYVSQSHLWVSPEQNYFWRVYSGALLFTVLAVGWATRFLKATSISSRISVATVSMSLIAALFVPQAVYTAKWSTWLSNYEQAVSNQSEWIPITQSQMTDPSNLFTMFNWFWTNPSMSLILRDGAAGGFLNAPDVTYNPYAPDLDMGDPTLKFRR